jgi:thioredoxin 1
MNANSPACSRVVRHLVAALVCLLLASGDVFGADRSAAPAAKPALPRLVDLGADQCIPCKMMAPILAGLARDYAGQLDVVFIDVWKDREAGKPYGIRVIPTQIFYDAGGRERFRHEGFYSQQEILKKWKELGVNLTARPAGEPARKT